ncbi:MAG TPA: AAA family ATPase [Chthoniobacterales bacterium]|nr:AAA family ATPase [Chthoniobacterales bacterium]
MTELSRHVFETLRKDEDFILYRGRSKDDGSQVLVLAPLVEYPAPEILQWLEHAYSLREELDPTWAARPIAIGRHWDRSVLILEDPGGVPLDQLPGQPLDLAFWLRLAIGLSTAIGHLHQRGIIHKDIKPANILVNPVTSQCWLRGFLIASRLRRERQAPEPPEFIAGTLPYMAPEQTGRMNRSIDSRSDLYSLGVTLYQMLTGSLPFIASDPMEWVHCHIARHPVPLGEWRKDVPEIVSAIILKLLSKTAEDRYQTVAGLVTDLRKCLTEWDSHKRISSFSLGTHDISDRLHLPEKLYGRDREIKTLLAAFDQVVTTGKPNLVLVSGYSGIGKSSVVKELHKVLVPPRGLFASGKFDQYKRDVPYATLAQAFNGLIRPLLSKSESELQIWRDAFCGALEPNAKLMVDLVPELELITGEQPPVPDLPPQDAQRRFQLVFRRFIAVFARPEHPLALFLDDLQWLDAATLDFLEDLLTQPDVHHLMLIGAYRDNEVDSTHSLWRRLEAIRQTGATVHDIVLTPLAREDLEQLIVDSLHCELECATPLAQLVQEKTGGNPFFVIQFIYALVEEQLLTFDHNEARWFWNLNRIHAKGYTDNVVELMVGKLNRLPSQSQKALQELACLGNSAEISMISIVHGTSEEQVHSDLWEAVLLEFIAHQDGAYKFVHDRIQEAAYSQIPEHSRAEAHLRIGRLLWEHFTPEKREEAIFEIVNQLNRAAPLITSQDERERLAALNLIAGERAKASTAYVSALNYLAAGSALLSDDCWDSKYHLIFPLELHRAECEFLTGQSTAAEERLTALSFRASNAVDLATVTCLLIDLYTSLNQSKRAVAASLDYLRYLGAVWSPHPTEEEAQREYQQIWVQLGTRSIEDLIELPLMCDPTSLGTMDVLIKLLPPAMFTDPNLLSLTVCRAVNLSLQQGHSDGSCVAYVWLGAISGPHFGNYEAGFRFGRLGYELVEKGGLQRFQARTYMWFGQFVMPWTKHLRASREFTRRAFNAAYKVGDLFAVGSTFDHLNTNFFATGDPLVEAQRVAEDGLEFAARARFAYFIDVIGPQVALIRTLRGLTKKFGSFDDEIGVERHFASVPAATLPQCWYWIRKLQARFFAGDYDAALDASAKAQQLLWTSPSIFETAEYHFYSALSHAASLDSAFPDRQRQHLEALAAHHRQLEIWAENCPENFENRVALVGAEIERVQGQPLKAEHLYELAIRSAFENGFVHNEALANELAARFYAARGFEKIAHTYLRDARYCYLRWGAAGKVRQLDELYPQLREEEPVPGPTSTIGTPVEHLDLATVIKVSQAVSGEIVLEKLIDTLMRTAVEHAGAERGLLILPRGIEQRTEAEATTSGETIIVRLGEASVAQTAMPESIVHYVVRTQEIVILDDALAQPPFAADTYIRQQHARSILCLPLINQAKLIGVLYLENNLASHVFTPTRIAVLKLLASQAAISLENTRLYRDLEEREAKIRRLVDANIVGIFIWNLEGAIIDANEAFLQMVGYSREDLTLGRLRWTDLTPADWHVRDERAIAKLEATGILEPFEKEYFRKDGNRVPVLIGAAIFEGSKNEGVAFVLDLSERKRGEEALLRSEAYLAQAQRLSQTGSFWWKVSSGEFIWSDEAFRVMGYDRTMRPSVELIFKRVHPEDIQLVQHMVSRAAREGTNMDFEHRLLMPDGSIKHIHVVLEAVSLDPANREFVGTVMDITARKQAEEAASQAQTELAHVARVTTLGEMTASIAHEINQPLAAVVTNANAGLRWLAGDSPNLAETREAIRRIIRDGNRAGEIIGRIRALAKKAPPKKDWLDVNETVSESIAMARSEVQRNRVLLQTNLANDLPLILGDKIQLQQVILNLLMNAIEAMSGVDQGPRELWVSSKKVTEIHGESKEERCEDRALAEPEWTHVLITVRDSGPGLDPQRLNRLFDAFYTTKPQGLGMGLAISRSIIEAHGGRLWAKANALRGALFQFTLPIRV